MTMIRVYYWEQKHDASQYAARLAVRSTTPFSTTRGAAGCACTHSIWDFAARCCAPTKSQIWRNPPVAWTTCAGQP